MLMRSQLNLLTFLVVLASIFIHGCNSAPDRSREIALIDSLAREVHEQEESFEKIDEHAVLARTDSIRKHVQHVQVNFVGDMSVSTAKLISSYKATKGNLPSDEEGFETVEHEIEYTKTQLENLKTLLTQNATIDATGVKIDEQYISQAIASEKTAAEDLVAKLKRMSIQNGTFFDQYDSLYPQIKHLVDSIQINPNAKTGFNIISHEEEDEEEEENK